MLHQQEAVRIGSKPKDGWEKVDIIGKLLGSIAIPLAVVGVGYFANIALQDRTDRNNQALQERTNDSNKALQELARQQKLNEYAITILQSTSLGVPGLREWAVDRFKKFVGNLPEESQKALQQGASLPSVSSASSGALADLDSEDTGARHAARQALAALGEKAIPVITTLLAENRTNPNYRQILGATVALGLMPEDIRCKALKDPDLRNDVAKHGNIPESTLKNAADKALRPCP